MSFKLLFVNLFILIVNKDYLLVLFQSLFCFVNYLSHLVVGLNTLYTFSMIINLDGSVNFESTTNIYILGCKHKKTSQTMFGERVFKIYLRRFPKF